MKLIQTSMLTGRYVCWFSYGAASAVAAKLACEKYKTEPLEIVNCDTSKNEHEDNARFRKDVEQWIGREVQTIASKKYQTIEEVFEAKKYMSGIAGAVCTGELKRVPRMAFQYAEDVHIFGYTVDEKKRITAFENENPNLFLEWILRDAGLDKEDCYQIIRDAGIKLPAMYGLGFDNNNCIGCVKAQSPSYWNRVRKYFPAVFKSRSEQSRRLGVRLVKLKGQRIFLDELPEDSTEHIAENLSCGPQCQSPAIDLGDYPLATRNKM
jgi:hypothetical protein